MEQHSVDKNPEKNEVSLPKDTDLRLVQLLVSGFDSTPMGLAILDTDMRYVRINNTLAQMNGIPAEEHIGRTVREAVPFMADQAEPIIRRVLDTGEPVMDVRFTGATVSQPGIMRHWRERWFPLRDGDGKVIGISAEVEDVTDHVRAEEALRESEAWYRTLHDVVSQGIFQFDGSGRIVSANRAACDILGIDFDDVKGRVLKDILSELDTMTVNETGATYQALDLAFIQASITGKGLRDVQVRISNPKAHEHRWILMDSIPRYMPGDDVPVSVFMIFTDITELKKSQEALNMTNIELENRVRARTRAIAEANIILKENRDQLAETLNARLKMEQELKRLVTAIDQAGEGFVLFNAEWVIEYVNPAYERLSGYAREELIGMDVEFLRDNTIGESYSEISNWVVAGGETWSGKIKRRKKSGEIIDISLTLSPVWDHLGAIINYVAVAQDISQEIRLQQMVVQAQKMEAIGSLAGGIAHDLKNIFTPILINSEIALEDTAKDNPSYPLLEEILDAARLGTDLVKQIMTFARRTPLKKISVDVTSIVSETLTLLRSAIPTTIEIQHRFTGDDFEVMADPTQIKQVIMNLGTNAAHAMKEHGGILDVGVSCVDFDRNAASRISPDLEPGTYVEIEVRDTGNGMDEKTLEQIFDPFFTTKRLGEGTGLGLAVARGIVKEHLGAIGVWSKPNRGSTFKVLLPRLEKNRTGKATPR